MSARLRDAAEVRAGSPRRPPSPPGTAGRCRGAAPRRAAGGRRGGGAAVGPPTWLIDRGGGGAVAPSPRGRTRASPRRPSPRLCLRTGDGGQRRPGFVPLPGPRRTQRRAQPGERGERRGACGTWGGRGGGERAAVPGGSGGRSACGRTRGGSERGLPFPVP